MNLFELCYAIFTVCGVVGGVAGFRHYGFLGAIGGALCGAAMGLAMWFAIVFVSGAAFCFLTGSPMFPKKPPSAEE